MLAICAVKGNQYMVKEGQMIRTEKVNAKKGDTLHIGEVLLVSDDKAVQIGTPYVNGYVVDFEVLDHGKGEKIRVFKMKPKKRYSRTYGHRQAYTDLKVVKIVKGAVPKAVKKRAEMPSDKVKEEEAKEKKVAVKKTVKRVAKKASKSSSESETALKKPAASKTVSGKTSE